MAESETYQKLRNGLEVVRLGLGEVMDVLSTDEEMNESERREIETCAQTDIDFFEQMTQGDDVPVSDAIYHEVIRTITNLGYASTLVLQTQLEINYRQAISVMGELERNGLVAPAHGFRPHKALPTAYALRERMEEAFDEVGD